MARKKDIKIILDTYGNFLGMEKGCIVLRDKERNETRYPLIENTVGEIVLNSGNMISTGLLTYLRARATDPYNLKLAIESYQQLITDPYTNKPT